MLTQTEQRALLAVLLHAALADDMKSDTERAALKRITEGLITEAINPWLVYQEVLGGRYPLEAAAADLPDPATRMLSYEMALGVCETDGLPNAAEKTFLTRLRTALKLPSQADAPEHAATLLAQALPAAVPAGAATAAAAATPPRLASVDKAALDKTTLNHAILTGALELLPQSLATMAILPLQMKLVYGIGKAHGYALDRGHIRDFLATAGAGLASQAVEGYARKLMGGLVGGLLGKTIGKGMLSGLGKTTASTATGAAITFATTYAIGQLAVRYYAGGRRMEIAVLKDTYRTLLGDGQRLFARHQTEIEQRATTLSPAEVINLVRQG